MALHINDTHPAMGVAELMRLLVDEYGYGWGLKAWKSRRRHLHIQTTPSWQALEKWPVSLFQPILPRIYSIIEEINRRFCLWAMEQGKQYTLRDTAIIMTT